MLQSIAQQINIERAHQMELFLSTADEELDLEDEEHVNTKFLHRALTWVVRPMFCMGLNI